MLRVGFRHAGHEQRDNSGEVPLDCLDAGASVKNAPGPGARGPEGACFQ